MIEETERPFVDCAHSGCISRAVISLGDSNLCFEHYNLKYREEALKHCLDQGLDTPEKRKEFAFVGFKKFMKNVVSG